jgi:hypothetical protein
VPSYAGRTARLFFMLEVRGTRGNAGAHLSWEVRSGGVGYVVAPKPNSAESARSKVIGHVVALELNSAGR